MRKARFITGVFLTLWIVFIITDFTLGTKNKEPIFSKPVEMVHDGGSTAYYGIGYKVIKYTPFDGPDRVDFGTWFMRYYEPNNLTIYREKPSKSIK